MVSALFGDQVDGKICERWSNAHVADERDEHTRTAQFTNLESM